MAATGTEAAPAPGDTSRLARMVERLIAQGGREQLAAEQALERQAASHAEARAAIATFDPRRAATAKAWLTQVATVRTAVKQLLEASARLTELAEADSDLYLEQDRIRFSAGITDPLRPRALSTIGLVDNLPVALDELEAQARRHLEASR